MFETCKNSKCAIFKQIYLPYSLAERNAVYQIILSTATKYGTTDEVTIVNNIWIVSKYLSNIITVATRDSQAANVAQCHLSTHNINSARFTLLHFIRLRCLHQNRQRCRSLSYISTLDCARTFFLRFR